MRKADTHVKLFIEVGEGSARVIRAALVDEPYLEPPAVAGSFAIRVGAGKKTLASETRIDPLETRGFGTPAQGGHHFGRRKTALVTVSVPLDSPAIPRDLSVELYRLAEPRSVDRAKLGEAEYTEGPGMQRVARFGVDDLAKVPGWRDVLTRLSR